MASNFILQYLKLKTITFRLIYNNHFVKIQYNVEMTFIERYSLNKYIIQYLNIHPQSVSNKNYLVLLPPKGFLYLNNLNGIS